MKTILVVDDEASLRNALKTKLDDNGFGVLVAVNGQDAIRIAGQSKIDLILLDLMMPGIHGTEVVAQLQKSGINNVPIIILTNVDTGSYQDGVVEYLIKSENSLDDILACVKHHLGISSK